MSIGIPPTGSPLGQNWGKSKLEPVDVESLSKGIKYSTAMDKEGKAIPSASTSTDDIFSEKKESKNTLLKILGATALAIGGLYVAARYGGSRLNSESTSRVTRAIKKYSDGYVNIFKEKIPSLYNSIKSKLSRSKAAEKTD